MPDTDAIELAKQLKKLLTPKLQQLPAGFFDRFSYTQTGTNLTHPLTWGALCSAVHELPEVSFVGIDVRFNTGTCKFQPDVVGFDAKLAPLIFVDYESPNSSDCRVPEKDIDAHYLWQDAARNAKPYILITTLPDKPSDSWELRYTSHGWNMNEEFKGRLADVVKNPFRFWYSHYRKTLQKRKTGNVAMLNINGNAICGPWKPNAL